MENRTFVYDPEKVVVTVAGIFLTGYSEDSKVEIEQNEDDVIPKVGVDGIVNYTINHDKTAKAKISLMSTSPCIPSMRALAKNNEEFDFSMVDMNDNGENIASSNCRIMKPPKLSKHKEAEGVDFEIFIPYFK